jgi:hypothetical protein
MRKRNEMQYIIRQKLVSRRIRIFFRGLNAFRTSFFQIFLRTLINKTNTFIDIIDIFFNLKYQLFNVVCVYLYCLQLFIHLCNRRSDI